MLICSSLWSKFPVSHGKCDLFRGECTRGFLVPVHLPCISITFIYISFYIVIKLNFLLLREASNSWLCLYFWLGHPLWISLVVKGRPPDRPNHFKLWCLWDSTATLYKQFRRFTISLLKPFKLEFSCLLSNDASLTQSLSPNHTSSKKLSEQIGL